MKNNITDIRQEPLNDGKFIQTSRLKYKQNGIEKEWEMVKAHDSVAILIYHKIKKSFVLVRQFRPAVYLHDNQDSTTELCAGIVDKDLSLKQIAIEEVEEECGYKVSEDKMTRVTSFYTSVGFAGSKQTLFYCEVDDTIKVSDGGGIDDELIEVRYLPTKDANEFILDESIAKTPGLAFAFMWWFNRS